MLSKDIFHVFLTTNNNEEENKFENVFFYIIVYFSIGIFAKFI